jgi:hypothetical protein
MEDPPDSISELGRPVDVTPLIPLIPLIIFNSLDLRERDIRNFTFYLVIAILLSFFFTVDQEESACMYAFPHDITPTII